MTVTKIKLWSFWGVYHHYKHY